MDIVFVIDGPPSITDEEFEKKIRFIINIINSFPVSPLGVHTGVVVQQPSNRFVIDLGRYKEKPHVDSAVREIISSLSDINGKKRSVVRRYEEKSIGKGRGRSLVIIAA